MNDDEILQSIQQGGALAQAAVKALYLRHGQHMLRYFTFQGLSADDARDALQETVVKIVRGASSYASQGEVRAWVWQIARNCMMDALRKLSRTHEEERAANDEEWQVLMDTIPAAQGRTDLALQDCIHRGVQAFGEKAPERAMALTLFMEGHAIEEIGLQLNRTTAATKEFLSQCRKKLAPYVSHCHDLLEA